MKQYTNLMKTITVTTSEQLNSKWEENSDTANNDVFFILDTSFMERVILPKARDFLVNSARSNNFKPLILQEAIILNH